jgi:hypothetical protein
LTGHCLGVRLVSIVRLSRDLQMANPDAGVHPKNDPVRKPEKGSS